MTIPLHQRIDDWMERLKWPAAIVAILWLPFVLWGTFQLVARVVAAPWSTIAYGAGLVLFVLFWRAVLRFRSVGPWLMRIEHEATHGLFAFLTAHRIIGLSRENVQGSHVRYVGRGNWLIQIAPYFFPTAAVLLWLIAIFIPFGFLVPWTSLALGVATGFHVVSTLREIRQDRAELESLSWKFCWLFLPTANLLMLGCLVAFSYLGFSGLFQFLRDCLPL